jgi:hypothetical protein
MSSIPQRMERSAAVSASGDWSPLSLPLVHGGAERAQHRPSSAQSRGSLQPFSGSTGTDRERARHRPSGRINDLGRLTGSRRLKG